MKKILAIVLVLLMALALFACNKPATTDTSEPPASTTADNDRYGTEHHRCDDRRNDRQPLWR